ncbi:FecR domain-containing protein [Curvivirga sp.]|uniref:FecR domain-containing protein n=1 Tax=Curvivirga sp. TaxID=2856848 RepID=UPI003B5B3758
MARLTNDIFTGIGGNQSSENMNSGSSLMGSTSLTPSGLNQSTVPVTNTPPLYLNAENQSELSIPDVKFVTDAQMYRDGHDLHLKLSDGETVVIENYFDQVSPPDLIANEGIKLTPQLVGSFLLPVAPGQVAQTIDGGSGDPIGNVEFLSGNAFAVRQDGSRVELKLGDPVYQGDQIETNSDGSIKLRFADETIFTLGEDARLALDELVYNPTQTNGNSAFSILKGSFVFVSGQIAHDNYDNMQVNTPVATIGIRGTTVTGSVLVDGEELFTFSVLEGSIDITAGGETISLTNNFDTAVGELDSSGSIRTFEVSRTQAEVIGGNNVALNALGKEDLQRLEQIIEQEIEAATGEEVDIELDNLLEAGEEDGTDTEGDDSSDDDQSQFDDVLEGDLIEIVIELDNEEDDGDTQTDIVVVDDQDPDPEPDPTPDDTNNNSETSGSTEDPPPSGGGIVFTPVSLPSGGGTFSTSAGDTTNYNVTGGDGDDDIQTGAGSDIIYAGAGNDTIGAGAGNDIVTAGTGNGYDSYDGGSGDNLLEYPSVGSGTDLTVTLGHGLIGTDSAGHAAFGDPSPLAAFGENSNGDMFSTVTDASAGVIDYDVFTNFNNLLLGAGDDSITVNNYTNSESVAINVDAQDGNDTVEYESASDLDNLVANGNEVVVTQGSYTQTLTNVETITEASTYASFQNGNDSTNLTFTLLGEISDGTLGASSILDFVSASNMELNFVNNGKLLINSSNVSSGVLDSSQGTLDIQNTDFGSGTELKLSDSTSLDVSTSITMTTGSTLSVDSGQIFSVDDDVASKIDLQSGAVLNVDGQLNLAFATATNSDLTIQGSGTVINNETLTLDTLTLSANLTNNDDLVLSSGETATINGDITNTGTSSLLSLGGNSHINGSGTLNFANSSTLSSTNTNSITTVFNMSDGDILTSGGTLHLLNGGSFGANSEMSSNGSSGIDLSGNFELDGKINILGSTYHRYSSGNFDAKSATYDGSGKLTLLSGALLELGTNTSILNSSFNFASYSGSTVSVASGQTFNNTVDFNFYNAGVLDVDGTFNNTGSLGSIANTTGNGVINNNTGGTLDLNGGTLTTSIANTGKIIVDSGDVTLTNDISNSSSTGTIEITDANLTLDGSTLTTNNQGTTKFAGNSQLISENSGTIEVSGSNASNQGILEIYRGTLTTDNLDIDIADHGVLKIQDSELIAETGGTIATNAVLDFTTGTLGGSTLSISDDFLNNGLATFTLDDSVTSTNAMIYTSGATFTNAGSFSFGAASTGTLTIDGDFVNTGTIALDNTSAQIDIDGHVDSTNGDLFIASNSTMKFHNGDYASTLSVSNNTGLSGDSGAQLNVNYLVVESGLFQVNDTDITLNIDSSVTASTGTIIYSDTNISNNVTFEGDNHSIDQDKTVNLASSATLTLNGNLTNSGTIDGSANSNLTFSSDTHYLAKTIDASGTLKFSNIVNDTPNDGSSITGSGTVELRLDDTHDINHADWDFMTADTITDNFHEILVMNEDGTDTYSSSNNGTTVVGSLSLVDNNGLDTFSLDLVYVTSDGVNNAGDLTFTGTSGSDVFYGGSGDDVATDGDGGGDVFYGNGGNDTFTLGDASTTDYINGGSGGQDVLVLDYETLDTNNWHINEFEIIDIAGQDSQISVNSDTVFAISEDTNAALSGIGAASGYTENALIFYSSSASSITLTGGFTQVSGGTLTTSDTASMGSYSDSYTIYQDTSTGATVYVGSNVSVGND